MNTTDLDITIACADDTDLDLTHDDCAPDGVYTRIAWEQWPPKQVQAICSCPCHKSSGTTEQLEFDHA